MSAPSYQVVVSLRVGSRHGKRIGAENIRRTLSNLLPALYAPGWKVEDVAVAVRKIGAGGESSVDEGRWDSNEGSENAV